MENSSTSEIFSLGIDKNIPKRQLHEESSSSEEECLDSPGKRTNVYRILPECADRNQPPNEASRETTGHGIPLNEDSNSSFAAECPYSHQKQSDIPTKSVENSKMDLLSTKKAGFEKIKIDSEPQTINNEKSGLETSTTVASEVRNKKENEPEPHKKTIECSKSPEIEVLDLSQREKCPRSSDFTSKIQYSPNGSRVVPDPAGCFVGQGPEEDSPEDAAANSLKLEYVNKYASEYSEELLFAVDVMTLVRHLNNLECKWIIYVTSGNMPASPCDEVLDEALGRLWASRKDGFTQVLETQTDFSYGRFQKLVLIVAEKFESWKYNEKSFLLYCLILAQWAVWAERNGMPDAIEFVPLVVCRTIQNLKDSEKLESSFWKGIAEEALNYTSGP